MQKMIQRSTPFTLLLLTCLACASTDENGRSDQESAVVSAAVATGSGADGTPGTTGTREGSETATSGALAADSSHQDADGQGADGASPEDAKLKMEELKRKLEIARGRLEIAHMELDANRDSQAMRMEFAKTEIALVELRAKKFEDIESRNMKDKSDLDLRGVRDRAQEAADELKQIEIMYDTQDLDDLTAEFVIQRGRRGAERAQQRIVIQARAAEGLERYELPAKRQGLALELAKANEALKAMEREGRIAHRNKTLGVREAEGQVVQLEGELAELAEAGSELADGGQE